MINKELEIDFPEVQAPHIIRYLFDAGPVMAGGMGPAPLSYGEIRAWQDVSGIELNNWEGYMLRTLSREYLSMSLEATKPTCPSPWLPEPVDEPEHAQKVAKVVKSALRG